MNEYKSVEKYLQKAKKQKTNHPFLSSSMITRILLSGILFLFCLCLIKTNAKTKDWIYQNVYQVNFSFAKINDTYQKYFGEVLPLPSVKPSVIEPVFSEQLTYQSSEAYKEGVKLMVGSHYLVPILESGIVVFVGEKENYGNTIIIQQVNGIDLWYVGVDSSNVKIYDYVEKGNLLGETISSEMYLYFQKAGEFLNYQEYLG